jgi:hypothetical protein
MRVLLIATMLAVLSVPARSECLRSAEAVWNAHPGSHASWRLQLPGHEGEKCWFAKGSTNPQAPRIRQVVDSPRGTDSPRGMKTAPGTDGQAEQASVQVKAPAADGPNENIARSGSQVTLPPPERGPSSILIWGRPMQIDPTWEEIFTKRERRGE